MIKNVYIRTAGLKALIEEPTENHVFLYGHRMQLHQAWTEMMGEFEPLAAMPFVIRRTEDSIVAPEGGRLKLMTVERIDDMHRLLGMRIKSLNTDALMDYHVSREPNARIEQLWSYIREFRKAHVNRHGR